MDPKWVYAFKLDKVITGLNINTFANNHFFPRSNEVKIDGTILDFYTYNLYTYYQSLANKRKNWWFEDVTPLFADRLTEGSVVYDIGANCGYYTLLSALRTGSDGAVVAFEPYDPAYEVLNRNVEQNSLADTVTTENVGVADTSGSGGIRLFGRNQRLSVDSGGEKSLTSVDEYDSDPPDVVKIDVEGLETQVLEGATETISEHGPVIFVEVHPVEKVDEMGGSVDRIYELLSDHGGTITRYMDGDAEQLDECKPPTSDDSHWLIVDRQT